MRGNDCALSYLTFVLFLNVYNVHCGKYYKIKGFLMFILNILVLVVVNFEIENLQLL
jgi:hypothetical protein